MKLIDVTLRDGGHTCDFDWPLSLANRLLSVNAPEIEFVEVGYWQQREKFSGQFYSLDSGLLESLADLSAKPLAVMMDFHYRTVSAASFAKERGPISLLRLTSRREDLAAASRFLDDVRAKSDLQVSLNLSNISNYSRGELIQACKAVARYGFDIVYFADTHGYLDLSNSDGRFVEAADILRESGKKVGFHLHNHRGYALLNHSCVAEWNFDLSDISLGGLGKGGGNLKSEQVLTGPSLAEMLSIKRDFASHFVVKSNPFFILTALHSAVDHYAEQLASHNASVSQAMEFLAQLPNSAKDVFDKEQLTRFLGAPHRSASTE